MVFASCYRETAGRDQLGRFRFVEPDGRRRADACFFLLERYNVSDIGEFVNIGVGKEITIRELAELIAGVVSFQGKLAFDSSKPDGTPRKLLDVSRIQALGWQARTGFREGVTKAYADYLKNITHAD